MNVLIIWLNINKLTLNINKSNIKLLNMKNKNKNITLNIKINNNIVKQVDDIKFLGIIIEQQTRLKNHINLI